MKIKLRPEVMAFAIEMEKKLRKNNGRNRRRGWKAMKRGEISRRIWIEWDELRRADDPDEILDECCDIANFAMMMADNHGSLLIEVGEGHPGR